MKITGIELIAFKYISKIGRDSEGHAHPGPAREAAQPLTHIVTDEGAEGYCVGGSRETIEAAKSILLGEDPWNREKIWQKLRQHQRLAKLALADRNIGILDMALWDLAGRAVGLPVYKLLGGFRDVVPAYASTMCGDDLPGGLDTPESYAAFAIACVRKGFRAFKLHTWMPPYSADPVRDVAACRAVREAVGPDIKLMLDPYHYYNREQALYIGRALEKLGYYWMEEPMDEHNMSSYVWLSSKLDLPICGPESAEGKMYTRAEWIMAGAADMSRYDVYHAGITPMMKSIHLCESFGVRLEVHGGGPGNLQVMGAMGIPGEYYEYGLLHPFINHEENTPWLKEPIDRVDSEGNVHLPQRPGLGMDINWDFVNANRLPNA